jgi:hypothetical protein
MLLGAFALKALGLALHSCNRRLAAPPLVP